MSRKHKEFVLGSTPWLNYQVWTALRDDQYIHIFLVMRYKVCPLLGSILLVKSSLEFTLIFQRVSPTLSYSSHPPGTKTHLPQGISVYPPNTYSSFLMIVIVWFFPSHLLWKVLASQPWVDACQHSAQLLSFPIAGERNCVTTFEITPGWKRK